MIENERVAKMELNVAQFAALVRYVVEAEKVKAPTNWKIPAIKFLRNLYGMDLKTAKDLVEAVEPTCDPVVRVINEAFRVY